MLRSTTATSAMTYPHIRLRYEQAKVHAAIVAVICWVWVFASIGLGAGNRSVFGPLTWSDFVHFYTLGDIAHTQESFLLYDAVGQQARQVALVPESSTERFIPVYAPQTALLFLPLALLPYFSAGLVWALITMAVYGWSVWVAWRPARLLLPDRRFLVAAALAFPPVWQLPGYGQTTAFVLVAFAGGWCAMEADRRLLAGVVLSLIAIKPQFGLVLAAVAIVAGEGRLIAGVLVGVGVQVLATLAVFDFSVFTAYAAAIRRIPTISALLEPQAVKMHSIRALTHLLPGRLDALVWTMLSVAVIVATAWVWRQMLPWRARFGVLVLASVLVNPHLTIYDVTLLVLPVLWIGGWLLELEEQTDWYWQRVYWIAAALMIPTAAIVEVQLSPILIAALFVRIVVIASSRARISSRPACLHVAL
jgi:alpha-1,2-mannosyltransferase